MIYYSRAIFSFITSPKNFKYKIDQKMHYIPRSVIQWGTCACVGFSYLFNDLGRLSSLQVHSVQLVGGRAKIAPYAPPIPIPATIAELRQNHAWSSILLTDTDLKHPKLIDVTWGMGSAGLGTGDHYFVVSNEEFLLQHFPAFAISMNWQLLKRTDTVDKNLQYVDGSGMTYLLGRLWKRLPL